MDATPSIGPDVLLSLVGQRMAQGRDDPFGNPVMSVALAITRMMDEGELDVTGIAEIVRSLRDAAFANRARRLASYAGGPDKATNETALAAVAQNVLRPDPADTPVPSALFRARVERARCAAVFYRAPTFALSADAYAALAAAASDSAPAAPQASHRPAPITLMEEFERATAAIAHGRDPLDRLNAAVVS